MKDREMLTLAGFADLLKRQCVGDWWDTIPPFVPDPEWGDCEACGFHPCTAEQADALNRLFGALRAHGAPSPATCGPHCAGDVFVEWYDERTRAAVILDVFNKFGRDALVRLPGQPVYFVDVADE